MPDLSTCVVFFDIGDTLASVIIGPNDNIEITPFPEVEHVLQDLRAHGAKLGIISNRGDIPEANVNNALKRAGLLQYFEPRFLIYGPKDSPLIFKYAAALVKVTITVPMPTSSVLMFVGEDAAERANARAVNYLVAPHPSLALDILMSSGAFAVHSHPDSAKEQL
jgi:leucyl aminopeptidase